MRSWTSRHPALADERGSIAIIFAASAFFVVLAIGLAIDSARAYNASARVGVALDAAAIAAAKLLDDEQVPDADIEDRARRFFAAHVGGDPIGGTSFAGPTIAINRATGEIDIAVQVHVPTTFGQLAGIPQFNFPRSVRVRYDQRRIDMAMVLDTTGSMCQPCTKMDGLKATARQFIDTLMSPQTPAGYVRIAVAPYSAAVNAGGYAGAASAGQSTDGCVVERSGPANATDAPPTGADALGTATTATNPSYGCTARPIRPLTGDSATLRAHINGLGTGGGTAGHIGLAWGWYMISQRWSAIWPTESRPKTPGPNVIKAVLLMTDGEFNMSYLPGPGLNSTSISVNDSSPEQAARLCANMKAEGVVVYTVAFQSPPEAQNLLSGCATSAQHAFNADNSSDLTNAFRTIAERLAALRLSL